MTRALLVRKGGPQITVQDPGREGYLAEGLSRGGAADRRALHEGAALLGQPPPAAAIEMAGHGGVFEAEADLRIALTGAPMAAEIDGRAVDWHQSHALPRGSRVSIGGARAGVYGYLHLGGGIATEPVLGARAVHLTAGLGRPLEMGDRLPVGADSAPDEVGFGLDVAPRFAGGTIRVVASLQTDHFPEETVARFEAATFRRDVRGNRMGVRVVPDGAGFDTPSGLSVLSEVIVPGDIQITGDGTPYVLLAECQTTGGYPRIATVIPADLPRVAQAGPGAELRFRFVPLGEADEIERRDRAELLALRSAVVRRVWRPEDLPDLLTKQLISGVTAGDDLEGPKT